MLCWYDFWTVNALVIVDMGLTLFLENIFWLLSAILYGIQT